MNADKSRFIPIVIKICASVISTGGLRSGLKWRDLAANEKQVQSESRFLDSASLRSK